MIAKVLESKLKEYRPGSALEQENALAELMQLTVLASLSRAGFFRLAEFHGGTFLRIVHGVDRFSEDLDFALLEADPRFSWSRYLDRVVRDGEADGLGFEATDKSRADLAVRKAFIKTDSLGALLRVELPFARRKTRKIAIRLEVDIDPPSGSTHETSFITFPNVAALTTQTLESAFASKLHALLCRGYVKGRDWYDFLWYAARGTRPNLRLLASAVDQAGPWAGRGARIDGAFVIAKLKDKVGEIDWRRAADDVRRFLHPRAQEGLALWSADLFGFHVAKLARTLA